MSDEPSTWTDSTFLDYVETHSQTPRALFSREMVVRFLTLGAQWSTLARIDPSTEQMEMRYAIIADALKAARAKVREKTEPPKNMWDRWADSDESAIVPVRLDPRGADLASLDEHYNLPQRDPERIDRILGLIREKWNADTDLRLCQMLGWALDQQCAGATARIKLVEDDVLEAALRKLP